METTTNKYTILLVEDDSQALRVMNQMLSLRFPDYKVHAAENGKTGLELYLEHRPHLIITDINMPEMNGIEMARKISDYNPDATYIVLTAYGNKEYLDAFNEIGYCKYLMKPLDFQELFDAIERCVPNSVPPQSS